ncbi:DUF3347 domain-containing protein [Salinimicrobium catena]|uniref:DUF3347 domain-containing protein n=1 Tax=Salinimicrobium catena TaxID=390640 RepID=UPI002FE47879
MRISRSSKIFFLFLLTLIIISCKDEKKEEEINTPASSELKVEEDGENIEEAGITEENASDAIIENYLKLKNALVADNQEEAANIGKLLVANFEEFEKSGYTSEEQKELTDIIEDAREHAEHISESPIDHQREHFDILSKDVIDLIAITGTGKKLYQNFCPMYNNNKGAQWLSSAKEIRNPYFGSKMMDCGEIQKEIN